MTQAEWIQKTDIPDARDSLIRRHPSGEGDWVSLASLSNWRHSFSDDLANDYPFWEVTRIVQAVFVNHRNLDTLICRIMDAKCDVDFHGLAPHDYRGYLGEYPSRLTYRLRRKTGELIEETEILGVPAMAANFSQLRGGEWEYDFSASSGVLTSTEVPTADFTEHLSLVWDGVAGWITADGTICSQELAANQSNGKNLIAKYSALQNYLTSKNMNIVWIVFQTKNVVTGLGGEDSPGIQEIWSAYYLSTGTLHRI